MVSLRSNFWAFNLNVAWLFWIDLKSLQAWQKDCQSLDHDRQEQKVPKSRPARLLRDSLFGKMGLGFAILIYNESRCALTAKEPAMFT